MVNNYITPNLTLCQSFLLKFLFLLLLLLAPFMIKYTNKRKSEQKAYNSIFTVIHYVNCTLFNTVVIVQSKIWFIML